MEESSILSSTKHEIGKSLSDYVITEVFIFYSSDMISRVMPGKKDFVSVTADGEKCHVQKRLILCNPKEAFVAFKEQHADKNIHFSKFAGIRRRECVLAGASGT